MKPNINDQVVQFVDLYEIVERQAEEITDLCNRLNSALKERDGARRAAEAYRKENDALGNENIEYTKVLEFIIAAYEDKGTDIQVARKMVKLAREALRRDTQDA
jgi:FtsZ-binding cell division protein ZapB